MYKVQSACHNGGSGDNDDDADDKLNSLNFRIQQNSVFQTLTVWPVSADAATCSSTSSQQHCPLGY